MSNNHWPGICNCCKASVPAGQGVLRYWNGAARKYAPKYALRSALGVLHALLCNKCDS